MNKKNDKQKLYEMMGELDPTFKLNEELKT